MKNLNEKNHSKTRKRESKLKKLDFHNGIGETLGFAAIIPVILFIFMYLITIFQIGQCEQRLIYASYMGGRAAVTSFTKEDAETALKAKVESCYATSSSSYYTTAIDVSGSWIKGNIALIQVAEYIEPILPISDGWHLRQIGMMIEHSHWIEK